MAASSPELPSDMIFEILTRTTLRTLDTCKCVSKEWKQQIEDDPNFMSLHDERTRNTIASGFVIEGIFHSTYVPLPLMNQSVEATYNISFYLGSLGRDTKILALSKGILCCMYPVKNSNDRYFVLKPTSGQWRVLPNPKFRDCNQVVAMVLLGSNPLRFKIVRLTTKRYPRYRCQIFDSSSFKWREIQTLTLARLEFIFEKESVFSKSSLYWQTTKHNIVAFHEPTETFRKFPMPEQVVTDGDCFSQYTNLVEFQWRLGLARLTENGKIMELWVVEGDPNQNEKVQWRKDMSIDIGMLNEKIGRPRPIWFSNDVMVLIAGFNTLVHYRIQDSTFDLFNLDSEMKVIKSIFPFRSDFETVCFE